MLKKLSVVFTLGAALSSAPAYSHHSFAATFTDDTITVEGVVEKVKFSNPHVIIYFDVTDEKGEVTSWVTEGSAATLLRRQGWDKNTVEKGDSIRVTGNSTRNGSPMVSTGTLVFIDPSSGEVIGVPGENSGEQEAVVTSTPMQLADGKPNLTGAWGHNPSGGRRGPGGGGAGGEGRGGPGGPESRLVGPAFNEVGAALQAKWDPKDDPQVQCKAPGLVRQAAFTPHPFKIEQYDDHVVISYEEYGSVRTIYFDDRDLKGGEHSNLGQSIARYEGQTLVVESTNLLANPTNPGGMYLSDQTTMVETYSRKEDVNGQSIIFLESVITDPGYLTEPWTITREKFFTGGYEFIEVDCEIPLQY
jgi:hypothetical protein